MPKTHRGHRRYRWVFTALTLTLLSGCISLYHADVQQGNVVTTEMLENLKLGMTTRQVRFLLGTPLIHDPFRPDRWEYPYTLEQNGTLKERHHLTVIFRDNVVVGVSGDALPEHLKAVAAP